MSAATRSGQEELGAGGVDVSSREVAMVSFDVDNVQTVNMATRESAGGLGLAGHTVR